MVERELLKVPGRGLEPLYAGPKPAVLPLNDPGATSQPYPTRVPISACCPLACPVVMGSLVKRRRKRMRKKKHKKMLRRTRHQRRK